MLFMIAPFFYILFTISNPDVQQGLSVVNIPLGGDLVTRRLQGIHFPPINIDRPIRANDLFDINTTILTNRMKFLSKRVGDASFLHFWSFETIDFVMKFLNNK